MFQKTILFFLLSWVFCCGEEIDLYQYEQSIHSQNGEDGILAKLFSVIAPRSRYCVEFGAFDGITGSNTYLLRQQGWKALLLDLHFDIPAMNLHQAFITMENINQLFEQYSVPCDLDFLSIDIDYNDFYIWMALDPKYRPAVLVIEYNAGHAPDQDKVVKYRSHIVGDSTNYYGASILAMYNLGKKKGYSLVYADSTGTNLFFIRTDIVQALAKEKNITFKNIDDVARIHHPPTFGKGEDGNHPQDPKNRPYLTSVELLGS